MGRKALALKDFIERCPNDIEILEYAGFVPPSGSFYKFITGKSLPKLPTYGK